MSSSNRSRPIQHPTVMPLREFLRGGYSELRAPTVIVSRNLPIGTWVPGQIDSEFEWSYKYPAWLRGGHE